MKKHTKKGRNLVYIGIWINAVGMALALVEGIPEPYPAFSIPLIIVGVLLFIVANFYREK
ncbi:hypothetical protein [Halalkalibacter okhensis]|uniref:hypothetical protein n=1 Tax=Halalkalibacter okhensis TaxID=333138 RepID=UPI000A009E63|nr:hypothetical protein [Halalkalibacter okhensis]